MASISGSLTNAAVVKAGTWGTAVAASTGDKYIGEISHSLNESVLNARSVGSGLIMPLGFTRGNEKPTVNLTGDAHIHGVFGKVLSQFMGADSVGSEITASQGDYKHTITLATSQSKYLTVAYESSSATVHEFPTCSARSLTIRTPQIPGYLEFAAELVANKLELSTSTNANATIAAATLVDTEILAPTSEDDFWIDTQASGSLASGDQFNILSYELNLLRPQDSANEIKGSAGNGSPIYTGDFSGTLKITVKELADHSLYTYFANETALKCRFTIEGSQIGSGSLKSLNVYIPRMQLIAAPDYSLSSPGVNPVTYTFAISAATSNPTGMSSKYPYFELINTLSTGYQA